MKKKSHYEHLKEKWLQQQKELHGKLLKTHRDVQHHIIGSVMLATTPFLSVAPAAAIAMQQPTSSQQQAPTPHITPTELVSILKRELPDEVRPLNPDEEKTVSATLSANFHITVTPELDGVRLNRSYGLIGKEQHLRRYPGDTIYDQLDENSETPIADGVAPGLGAWGYFAPSKEQMTTFDAQREKYYIAVPTFLAPGWEQNVGKYGLFFKYRKMLVVNPENGKAIVADIADAGPAEWTGKHLGGSPEVMHYLDRVDGAQRGPVLYFFIDDPHDTIPLGPINL
jgi:hypothetical protein